MTDPSENDDALLRRLNQLKKSSVQFSPQNSSPGARPEEDIASRFLRLNGGLKDDSTSVRSTPATATTVGENNDETLWNPEDDIAIEELLAELGTEDQWTVDDGDEESNAEKLLEEAEKALDTSQDLGPDVPDAALDDVSEVGGGTREHGQPREDEKDEEEAERYVAKVLEELDFEKKYGKDIGDNPNGGSAEGNRNGLENAALLEFPFLPTSDPKHAKPDNDTTATSLQYLLPSAPTFAPSSKKKKKSSLPAYTDAEIATWCIICNDDATVQCLGCDGDLYCRGCWGEGHTGADAGLEERRHRWVVFHRPGG